MSKRLLLAGLVLAMVAAACSSDDGTTETTAAPEETTATTEAPAPPAQTGGGLLGEVIARGSLKCGVSTVAIGFAELQDDGSYAGYDADYCRALAAALGVDVEWVGTTSAERFTALANGEVDVLFRTTTWTQSRDTEIGGDFGPTTFYDGQQVMGKATDGFTEASTLADVDGAVLCTNAGTTTEKNITEGAASVGATIQLSTVTDLDQAQEGFLAGTCDLITTDGSGLYARRASNVLNGNIAEGDWVIFPTAPISKEPLGPMYRQNDSEWADVVNWLVYALIIAEEKGITQGNVDSLPADIAADAEVGRLLGTGEDELQTVMGLSADAWVNAIREVGNFGEIYARHLDPLGFIREGTPNELWFDGGLVYAPPAR